MCLILLSAFDALADSAEDSVKDARLLAILQRRTEASVFVEGTLYTATHVLARLSESVVQIVILDCQLHLERAQHYAEQRVGPVGSDAAVAERLDVEQVRDSKPHLDERELGCNERGDEWYAEDLDALLNVVCRRGRERGVS